MAEHNLKQVKVRLKLEEDDGLLSPYPITNQNDAIYLMRNYLSKLDREHMVVVNLDVHNRPLSYNVVSIGSIDQSLVPMANLFKASILENAAKVMLFHNHPSGIITPSQADRMLTARAVTLGQLNEIEVVDHIIIAPHSNQYYSFAAQGDIEFTNPNAIYNLTADVNHMNSISEPTEDYKTYTVEIEEVTSRAVAHNEMDSSVEQHIDDVILGSNDYKEIYIHGLDVNGDPIIESEIFGSNENEYIIDDTMLDMSKDIIQVSDIEEVSAAQIEVQAESLEDAILEVRRQYMNNELILTADHFLERNTSLQSTLPYDLEERINSYRRQNSNAVIHNGATYSWKIDNELTGISESDSSHYADSLDEISLAESNPAMGPILESIEGLGWTSRVGRTDSGYTIEFENYSAEGEDLIEEITFDGTPDDFIKEWRITADNFDADEHAAMWYQARLDRPSVAPDLGLRGFLDDAESIQEMYDEVVSKSEAALEQYQSEEHEYAEIDGVECELDDKWIQQIDGATVTYKIGHPISLSRKLAMMYISSAQTYLYDMNEEDFKKLEQEKDYNVRPNRSDVENAFYGFCKDNGYADFEHPSFNQTLDFVEFEDEQTEDQQDLEETTSNISDIDRLNQHATHLPDNTHFDEYYDENAPQGMFWYVYDRDDGEKELVVVDSGYGQDRYYSESFFNVEDAIRWLNGDEYEDIVNDSETTQEQTAENIVDDNTSETGVDSTRNLSFEDLAGTSNTTDLNDFVESFSSDPDELSFSDLASEDDDEVEAIPSEQIAHGFSQNDINSLKQLIIEFDNTVTDNHLLDCAVRLNLFAMDVDPHEYNDTVGSDLEDRLRAIANDAHTLASEDRDAIDGYVNSLQEYLDEDLDNEQREIGQQLISDLRDYATSLEVDELARAKELINNWYEVEYDRNADESVFEDLTNVPLAFTTSQGMHIDDLGEINVYADLDNFQLKTYLDNHVIEIEQYANLKEMNDTILSNLDFNELVSLSSREAEEYLFVKEALMSNKQTGLSESELLAVRYMSLMHTSVNSEADAFEHVTRIADQMRNVNDVLNFANNLLTGVTVLSGNEKAEKRVALEALSDDLFTYRERLLYQTQEINVINENLNISISEKSEVYRYYSTARPVSIGTHPDGAINVVNYVSKQEIDDSGVEAWGYVEYNHELSEAEMNQYQLRRVYPNSFITVLSSSSSQFDTDKQYTIDEFEKIKHIAGEAYDKEKAAILARYDNDIESVMAEGTTYESHFVSDAARVRYQITLRNGVTRPIVQNINDYTATIEYLAAHSTTNDIAEYLRNELESSNSNVSTNVSSLLDDAIGVRLNRLNQSRAFWTSNDLENRITMIDATAFTDNVLSKDIETNWDLLKQDLSLTIEGMMKIPSTIANIAEPDDTTITITEHSDKSFRAIEKEKNMLETRISNVREQIDYLSSKQYGVFQRSQKVEDQKELDRLQHVTLSDLSIQLDRINRVYDAAMAISSLTTAIGNTITTDATYKLFDDQIKAVLGNDSLFNFAASMTKQTEELSKDVLHRFEQFTKDDYINLYQSRLNELLETSDIENNGVESTPFSSSMISERKASYGDKKSSKQQMDEYRKKVADSFLKVLDPSSKSMTWVKQWRGMSAPVSMTTGKQYRGMNYLNLLMAQMHNGYKDPRWVTFNGLEHLKGAKNAHVKKGEHGVQIQRWIVIDTTKQKGEKGFSMDFPEWRKLLQQGREEEDFRIIPKYYYVFNAEQCEGIPPLEIDNRPKLVQSDFVSKVSQSMGVPIMNDGGNQSYYSPSNDIIHLPDIQAFNSEYAYNATALHELGHATGAVERLNRDINNYFGDDSYAFEELVAEMTSCMSAGYFQSSDEDVDEYIKQHSENHLAYVQSWANAIKDKPKILETALELATNATDFIDLHGGNITLLEYNQMHSKDNPVEYIDGKLLVRHVTGIDNQTVIHTQFRDHSNDSYTSQSVSHDMRRGGIGI